MVLQFVVDTMGRVDPSSIHDLWASDKPRPEGIFRQEYESFVEASRRALVMDEFEPAKIGGCKISAPSDMPFVYKLLIDGR